MRDWLIKKFEKLDSYAHDFVPSAKKFLTIDVDKVSSELRLADEGKSRGEKELPPSTATDLDEIEHKVTTRILDRLRDAQGVFNDNLGAYNERLGVLNLDGRGAEIRSEARNAQTDLDKAYRIGVDALYRMRKDVVATEDDLAHFKEENGLRRLARYPDSKTWYWAVLLAILLFESILNGYMFGQGDEFGLIGGWIFALIIAFLNVVLIGRLGCVAVRCLYHRRAGVRTAGGLLVVVTATGLVGLSLLGAHLRTALKSGAVEYDQTALTTFLANPFDLGDAVSWLFVLLTAGFAVIAVVDYLRMDDPYFGYGAHDRSLREKEQDYADEKANLIGEMTVIRDEHVGRMREELEQMRAHLSSHDRIMAARAALGSDFSGHLDYLEGVANTLLGTYRGANGNARKTPAPEHFGQRWKLPRPDIMVGPQAQVDLAEIRRKVAETTSSLETSISQVQTACQEYLRKYDTIEELPREELARGPSQTQAA